MIHYKLPAQGIDRPIFELQKLLHEGLSCIWKLSDQDYQCYGRVYKNPIRGGYIPEAYMGDGEYREVLLDDAYKVISFFGEGDNTGVTITDNVVPVHIVFFAHLGAIASLTALDEDESISLEDRHKIAASNPERADAEARAAVQAILGQNLHGFTLEGVIKGPGTLQEYLINRSSGQAGTEARGMKEFDMHPFHVFRINGTLKYESPKFHNYN